MAPKGQLAILLRILKHAYGFTVIAVFVLAFSIFTLSKLGPQQKPSQSSAQTAETTDVTFNGSDYSPSTITIRVGDTVRWTNNHTTEYTQVSSDPHPFHTDYLPLNVGLLEPNGGVGTLVFNDIGVFGYHDHLKPSANGTITVIAAPTATNTPTPTQTPQATSTNTPTPTSFSATATSASTSTPKPSDTPFLTYEEFSASITIVPTDTPYPTPVYEFVASTEDEGDSKRSLAPFVFGASLITFLILFGLYYMYKKQGFHKINIQEETKQRLNIPKPNA